MSETTPTPEESFAWAQERMAEAKAAGDVVLDLNESEGRALERLPDEISELTQLELLNLDNTQLSDLRALAGLSGLQRLDLDNTQVSDLGALSGLSGLQSLYLDNTQVSDLRALAGLSELQTLSLNNTQVSDLAPLQGLGGLQRLVLNNTPVSDLRALEGLSGLQVLNLNNTQVSDLDALSGLSGLQTLYLDHTQVSDLLPLAGLSKLGGEGAVAHLPAGLSFAGTPAAERDDAHRVLAEIADSKDRAKQVLLFLNGEHPEFGGPPEPYRPLPNPYDFASQDRGGIQYRIDGYLLRVDMHSDPPPAMAAQMLPELQDSVEDLIETFDNPNSTMAKGILRRAKRMQAILENPIGAIAEDAVVLWQASVALGSFLDEHALAVADGADPLDRLNASRLGALQRVIESAAVFVRLFPAAEALDDSRGGFLRNAYGAERIQRFIDHLGRAQVLDAQSALFIKALADIAAREGPQADKARSVTMTGVGTLIRIVTHYGKGALKLVAAGVGAHVGAEIAAEFELGKSAATMLRGAEQDVRALLNDLAPDVRNAVRGALEEVLGSDVPLPPKKPGSP